MASTPVSETSDGPVLSVINKRLRALKKKLNRINQMEESIAQGKSINKEQEEVLKSKPSLLNIIDELEKLRPPLSAAVSEEITLAAQRQPPPPSENNGSADGEGAMGDLLNLIYLALLFDVKSQSDFTATILSRNLERECCLAFDHVTDEATDLLRDKDLDLIAKLGGLLISRPTDCTVSHKNALQSCIQHARLWLANSQQPIEPNAEATYAGLREKLKKIIASAYFTLTPQIKPPVQMTAAAGNYMPMPFQVPLHTSVVHMAMSDPVQGSVAQYEHKIEATEEHEAGDNQSSPQEEIQKEGVETSQLEETVSVQIEEPNLQENQLQDDVEQNHREVDHREQQHYNSRRPYNNHRGGVRGGGGGRRGGYPNGRGGRGRGGGHQNGRQQYYDQPGNYYPSNNYNRSRGGGGGPAYNNHHGSQGGYSQADVGASS